MKKIHLAALFLFAFIGTTFSSALAAQWIYLGGAATETHCCNIAGAAGYDNCKFGVANVGGFYVANACFAANLGGGNQNNDDDRDHRNNQFKTRFEETAYGVQWAAFDVDWYIVSHNGDVGSVVYEAMNAPHDALREKLNAIYEKSRYGRDAYDLRNEIAEAKVLYGRVRTAYQSVEYLVRPSGKRYWSALEQKMRTF